VLIAGALAAAATAVAATGVRWSPLLHGTTEPSGAQAPKGYLAVTRLQERSWAGRLTPADRTALARVDLTKAAVLAAFLDRMPCATKVTTTGVTRSGSTVTVRIAYTSPPIGVAACVRTSTAYVVLGASRTSLGALAPTRVNVVVRARA
jgi:hypothetical protein